MKDIIEKYDLLADRYRAHDYADPERYFEHKAQLVAGVAPRLEPGDLVLDLACGDGGMAVPLLRRGLRYRGVDASEGMLAAARRLQPEAEFVRGRLDEYSPPEPVEATICMRAFYFAPDRRRFFEHVASYTRTKFVFDFDPRAHGDEEVLADVAAAGFSVASVRPILIPQRRRLPSAVQTALFAVEPSPVGRFLPSLGFPPRLLVTATT